MRLERHIPFFPRPYYPSPPSESSIQIDACNDDELPVRNGVQTFLPIRSLTHSPALLSHFVSPSAPFLPSFLPSFELLCPRVLPLLPFREERIDSRLLPPPAASPPTPPSPYAVLSSLLCVTVTPM